MWKKYILHLLMKPTPQEHIGAGKVSDIEEKLVIAKEEEYETFQPFTETELSEFIGIVTKPLV